MQWKALRAVVNPDISIYSLLVEDETYFQLRLTQMRLPISQAESTRRLTFLKTRTWTFLLTELAVEHAYVPDE